MDPLLGVLGFLILLFTLIVFLIFIKKLVMYFYKRNNTQRITLATTLIGVILFLAIFIYNEYFFRLMTSTETISKKVLKFRH